MALYAIGNRTIEAPSFDAALAIFRQIGGGPTPAPAPPPQLPVVRPPPGAGLPRPAPVPPPMPPPQLPVVRPVARAPAPVPLPGPMLRRDIPNTPPGGISPDNRILGPGGGMQMRPGADLRNTVPIQRAIMPVGPGGGGGLGGAGSTVSLAGILGRLPGFVRSRVQQWLRGLGPAARGTRQRWESLPGWLQQVLIFMGITAGADLAIDTGPDDVGLVQWPGTSDFPAIGGVGGVGPGVSIIGGWTANGVQFYRLSDGRFAVQNSRGRWKVWRVKKPIVLFASGAKDIPTFLRADKALNKQSKALRTTLNRRAPGPKRRPKVIEGQVVTRGGGQIIKID